MINYEFHITVKNANREHFIAFCKKIKVKPIILVLYANEHTLDDVMTSHTKQCTSDEDAYQELQRVKNLLILAGFNIVREKIEADYIHPEVPLVKAELSDNPHKYLESHLNIEVTKDTEQYLSKILTKDFHISKNAFKKLDEQTYVIMATFRTNKMILSEFKDFLNETVLLLQNKFKVHKQIIEYAIYDSNVQWDEEWIKG